MLRSPETDSFDLLEVDSQWSVWIGSISTTTVSTECDFCDSDVDCNLNGICNNNGLCDCYDEYGAQFLGTHCQTKVLDSCRTIVGEGFNETFSISYYPKSLEFDGPENTFDTLFSLYSRPVYRYIGGMDNHDIDPTTDFLFLMYTGSRWFGVMYDLLQPPLSWSRKHPGQNMTMSDLVESNLEFHGEKSDAPVMDSSCDGLI